LWTAYYFSLARPDWSIAVFGSQRRLVQRHVCPVAERAGRDVRS
jgi:hypothetical protein